VRYFAAIPDNFKRGMDEFLRIRGISPDLIHKKSPFVMSVFNKFL